MTPGIGLRWLLALSWPALRAQAGRQLLALLAIMLGVALAYGVHLLNATALAEFGSAAASVDGRPDLQIRTAGGTIDETLYAGIAALPGVQIAAPVVEGRAQTTDAGGERFGLRVIGLDALQSAALSPGLLPADPEQLRLLLDPERVFLNNAALRRLAPADAVELRAAQADASVRTQSLKRGGRSGAGGAPLAVLDIAGAQALLGRVGSIDRIDLRLVPGLTPERWMRETVLPAGLVAAPPPDAGARLAGLTRAYRVNLGVLSLMALFTGSFLVFSVISLSVAQRQPQLALLGVLGMTARERAGLVLAEALTLGLVGSLLGLLLGWTLAGLGLRVLGADLGLAAPAGTPTALSFTAAQLPVALVFGALGLAVSLASAALPALAVRRMPVAQVLKGLGGEQHLRLPPWLAPILLLAGVLLALLPPLGDMPIAAYASMLALLSGGIACVPQLLRAAVAVPRRLSRRAAHATALLVAERARDQAAEASRALAGVLVSLSLSVAMLVMIGSFRASLDRWLGQVLPADLYVRSSLRIGAHEGAPLAPTFVERAQASGLAARIGRQRSGPVRVAGMAEPVGLSAREFDERHLPLAEDLYAGAQDLPPIYVNEALRDALDMRPGRTLELRLPGGGAALRARVRGVWRDYASQSPALIMPLTEYRRWSGDARVTELYLWLAPGRTTRDATERLRALAAAPEDLEIAAASELRGLSMQIFDRSFAVTHWLQAVALAIGLFGIAASQSAQVLARRKEFGLLRHLGFTRGGVLRLLALEAALLCGVGALAGLALGLGLAAVLVFVVNPQSFHWSMDMSLPGARLAALVAAVFAAGVLAALLAGRRAAGAEVVQSVREDW